MEYALVETCCGSAALTLHLLGARRALLPYQGSKWRFRRSLEQVVRWLGFEGPPTKVFLTDSGPWGSVMGTVLDREHRKDLRAHLEDLAARDPRDVWETLQGQEVPLDPVAYAAEFLFLQRLSFSGKAVSGKGVWRSPGLNESSAYGLPATDRFGEVKPMVPSLLRVLEDYDNDLAPVEVWARTQGAIAAHPRKVGLPALVYIDPNYVDRTGYPDGMLTRREVVQLARRCHAKGAVVMISEAEPIRLDEDEEDPEPEHGAFLLSSGRKDTSPFRSKDPEWVTFLGRSAA